MPGLCDVPVSVLHDILSIAIDNSGYEGWRIALRRVNRHFNEAVLYVYFVRKRLVAAISDHSVDCARACGRRAACQRTVPIGSTRNYVACFNLSAFLTRHDHPDGSIARQYWHRWREAQAILRDRISVDQLDARQRQSYLILSENDTFGDVSISVLATAICAFIGPNIQAVARHGASRPDDHRLAAEFWVAVSACVIGDLPLLQDTIAEAKMSVLNAVSKSWLTVSLPAYLLMTAVENAHLHIVEHLIENTPKIMAVFGVCPLFSATFSYNENILITLLKSTPTSLILLEGIFSGGFLLNESNTSSHILRALVQHFSPISATRRTHLIRQCCAVGDIALLKEFADTEPLYSSYQVTCDEYDPWSWMCLAARFGHLECLKFLLAQSSNVPEIDREVRHASRHALVFNHIECYRELYEQHQFPGDSIENGRHSGHRSMYFFHYLVMADGAVPIIQDYVSRFGSLVAESDDASGGEGTLAATASSELKTAIERLRADNVRFLLEAGVRLSEDSSWGSYDPTKFVVKWPYFNANREAYVRTQEVLEEFSMPRLYIDS